MFMTSKQLTASIRNERRDATFWANAEKVAKHEREVQEYEDFCQKYGYPE